MLGGLRARRVWTHGLPEGPAKFDGLLGVELVTSLSHAVLTILGSHVMGSPSLQHIVTDMLK